MSEDIKNKLKQTFVDSTSVMQEAIDQKDYCDLLKASIYCGFFFVLPRKYAAKIKTDILLNSLPCKTILKTLYLRVVFDTN